MSCAALGAVGSAGSASWLDGLNVPKSGFSFIRFGFVRYCYCCLCFLSRNLVAIRFNLLVSAKRFVGKSGFCISQVIA